MFNIIYIPLILRNFKDQHISRVAKLLSAFIKSANQHVRLLGLRAWTSTFGLLGRNWVRCNTSGWCRQAGDLLDNATAHSVRELLDTRDGGTALSGSYHNDVCVFLDELCRA